MLLLFSFSHMKNLFDTKNPHASCLYLFWFEAMSGLNIVMFMSSSQGSSADRSQWREPTRTSDGLCSLYEAALCLFEEVRKLPVVLLEHSECT